MTVSDDQTKLIRITPEIRTRLLEYKDNTGVGINKLLNEASNVPEGLTPGRIGGWLSGVTKNAYKDHLDFALTEWQKYPQYEFVRVTEDQRKELLFHKKRTGISPAALLWKHRGEYPEGLSDSLIKSWMKSGKRKTPKKYIDYVLKCWQAQPDEKQVYIFSDKKMQRHLKQALEKTGLSAHQMLLTRGDTPAGLTRGKIDGWIAGKTQRIKRADYDYFLKICEEYAENGTIDHGHIQLRRFGKTRVVIPESYVRRLKEEIDRTGRAPSYVLKYHGGADKAKIGIVMNWLSGTAKTAIQEDMDYVMGLYKKYPTLKPPFEGSGKRKPGNKPKIPEKKKVLSSRTEGYLPIDKERMRRLKHYRKKANLLPGFVIKESENVPKGLSASIVSGWLQGTSKTANPEHVEWVLKRCRELLLEALEE